MKNHEEYHENGDVDDPWPLDIRWFLRWVLWETGHRLLVREVTLQTKSLLFLVLRCFNTINIEWRMLVELVEKKYPCYDVGSLLYWLLPFGFVGIVTCNNRNTWTNKNSYMIFMAKIVRSNWKRHENRFTTQICRYTYCTKMLFCPGFYDSWTGHHFLLNLTPWLSSSMIQNGFRRSMGYHLMSRFSRGKNHSKRTHVEV